MSFGEVAGSGWRLARLTQREYQEGGPRIYRPAICIYEKDL